MSSQETQKKPDDPDYQLIQQAKAGNHEAHGELFSKHAPRLKLMLKTKLSLSPEVADDILQKTYIKSHRGIENFREESTYYTWIYRVAFNTGQHELITTSRQPQNYGHSFDQMTESGTIDLLSSNNDTPDKMLYTEQGADILAQAIENLPQKLKEALKLREFEGSSYEEIAKITDTHIGTVRTRIFRARKSLAEKCAELGFDDYALWRNPDENKDTLNDGDTHDTIAKKVEPKKRKQNKPEPRSLTPSELTSDIANWKLNLTEQVFEFAQSNNIGIITNVTQIPIPKTHFDTLRVLFKSSGAPVSHHDLCQALKILNTNTLKIRVSRIRSFFKENAIPLTIPKEERNSGISRLSTFSQNGTLSCDKKSQQVISNMWYQAVQNAQASRFLPDNQQEEHSTPERPQNKPQEQQVTMA